ncbi:hypothetical protein EKO27_g8553 [Xylaria grammica]|uniref:Protein kinase domain-containing protein n=1 Tax=Xylaria grammica TaxID=363999 RepID=A0A439CWF4_9PEZI|nr:hypothetical protein EKO27_g8553 [Xylaria grammica]
MDDETRRDLQQYFERDEGNRFELVSAIASGQHSVAWKVKFQETPTSNARYIVLKIDRKDMEMEDDDSSQDDDDDNDDEDDDNNDDDDEDDDEDDDDKMDVDDGEEDPAPPESQTPNEKNKLRALRWAKHVVSSVEVTNDPLRRVFPGVPPHQMDLDSWLYVEYLENGTISKLLEKARQKRIIIPNRILWRFFLCLIRMVIAMGWPPAQPAGNDAKPVLEQIRGPPYGGLIHNDMHEGNVMLGTMIPNDPDFEHSLTPILCLIDLGSMDKVPNTKEANIGAVHNNIFDIALLMISLITRNEELGQSIVPDEASARPIRLQNDQPPILTNATPLLPGADRATPFGWLDPDLRIAVCACLAARPSWKSIVGVHWPKSAAALLSAAAASSLLLLLFCRGLWMLAADTAVAAKRERRMALVCIFVVL